MVKKLSCFLIAISSFGALNAQEWTFIRKYNVQQKITACDIGSLGKLYVGTERGNVYSFHMDGTPDAQFSSAVFQPVTDLDASNSRRIFVFYRDANQFEYLDRFAALPRIYQLEDFGIPSADHAALDEDGTIWFLSGLTLSHVYVFNHSLLSEQVLPSTLVSDSITDMAYDQRIILSDKGSGISYWNGSQLAFDMRLATGVDSFDLFSNELVALSDQGILIYNQLTDKREWIKPPRQDFERMVKAGDVFHFIRGSEIFSYRLEE